MIQYYLCRNSQYLETNQQPTFYYNKVYSNLRCHEGIHIIYAQIGHMDTIYMRNIYIKITLLLPGDAHNQPPPPYVVYIEVL